MIQLAPEIEIMRTGVPCGFDQKEVKPGYVLTDGTILLESERDSFGRYKGGTGMDGIYLPTGQIYAPVPSWKGGEAKAFQLVKPVTNQDRETEFLASQIDVLAIYRLKPDPVPDGHMPLARLQESGESPLAGNYGIIRVTKLIPGSDSYKVMEAYRTDGSSQALQAFVTNNGIDLAGGSVRFSNEDGAILDEIAFETLQINPAASGRRKSASSSTSWMKSNFRKSMALSP